MADKWMTDTVKPKKKGLLSRVSARVGSNTHQATQKEKVDRGSWHDGPKLAKNKRLGKWS